MGATGDTPDALGGTVAPSPPQGVGAGFADELDEWLRATAGEGGSAEVDGGSRAGSGVGSPDAGGADPYVVERVVKRTADELTEVVRRAGAPGSEPLVRKTFSGGASRGNAYRRLFEAQRAGRELSHVPRVHACDERDGSLVVVCEYVAGETLRELVGHVGAGPDLLRMVGPGLCEAVEELHTALEPPMIHRDIKPGNVIVGGAHVSLIDLGIARDYVPGATRDTVRYGTPGYAPPEQFGYGQTTTASDLYALGMTLAYCLTGEDPAPTLREEGYRDERIPQALRPVLARATRFDPQERYASAAELKTDLERALGVAPPLPSRRELRVASNVLGRVWNVALALLWAVVIAGSVLAIVDPTPENAQYPLWFLVLEYVGVVMVPGTALAVALLDKRRLGQRVPLPSLSPVRWVLYAVGFTLACWAVVFGIYWFLGLG